MTVESVSVEQYKELREAVEKNAQAAAALDPSKCFQASVEIKTRVFLRAIVFGKRRSVVIADENAGSLIRLTSGKVPKEFSLELLYRKLSELNGIISVARVRLQTALSRERVQASESTYDFSESAPKDPKNLH